MSDINQIEHDFRIFFASFLETALWASIINNPDNPEDLVPVDSYYEIDDLSEEAINNLRLECRDFFDANYDLLCDMNRAGHLFFLNKNRHGSGFWDGDYNYPTKDGTIKNVGKFLSEQSKPYGSNYFYVGDDGMLYTE